MGWPPTLEELRVLWHERTRAVAVRLGGGVENTVVYAVDDVSAQWWEGFHGGRVDLGQVRGELGIGPGLDPVIVVVQSRRESSGTDRLFLLTDGASGEQLTIATPRELGRRVAKTAQYRRVAGRNGSGPVVLVVMGGSAGLGALSREQLVRRFAEGLREGGDRVRDGLLAYGYISHDPRGFGLVAARERTEVEGTGLVLRSGLEPSVLPLQLDSAKLNALAYPTDSDKVDEFRRIAAGMHSMKAARDAVGSRSPAFVLAWITPGGRFTVADSHPWRTEDLRPREFARQVVEDLRSHRIGGRASNTRAVVVFTYFWGVRKR